MNFSPGAWWQENRGVYWGNASSIRDFRVQLRGSRSVLLFGVYLSFLIVVALLVYANSTRTEISPSIVMGMLGAMISLVTPALSATAIVAERQRKSLDLVFSAPVTPKYYLVGKMLSSYRYSWMLLVLSLPVTAACVVLGGASWQDVLVAYGLLSFQGIIFSSLALLISATALKPANALVQSYGSAFALTMLSLSLGATLMARSFMGASTNEQPFFVAFNPFLVAQSAQTYTVILGHPISNVFFIFIAALLVSRLCLLAAGAILRPYGGKEVQALRTNGLVYYIGTMALFGYSFASALTSFPNQGMRCGQMMFWASMLMAFVVSNLSAIGYDVERRFWPNGLFSIRQTFNGRPAGSLPYIVLLTVAGCAAFVGATMLNSSVTFRPSWDILPYVVLSLGFWVLCFGCGRFASSVTLITKSARGVVAVVIGLLVFLPPALLSALFPEEGGGMPKPIGVWDLYILRPVVTDEAWRPVQALVYGSVLLAAGIGVSVLAERALRRTITRGTNAYASIAATSAV